MKRIIIYLLLLILILIILPISAHAEEYHTNWTKRQNALHIMADNARANGASEDDEFIQWCIQEWQKEQENINILAKVMWKESGGCSRKHRLCVGQVVLNRVASEHFPNTIFDVVNQTSSWYDEFGKLHTIWQYNPSYCYGFENTPKEFYVDAIYILDGEAIEWIPNDVFWQAEFPQGQEIWWISHVKTEWGYKSTTYFCRGVYNG